MKVYKDMNEMLRSITRTMDFLFNEEHCGTYEGKMCIGTEYDVEIGDGWFKIDKHRFDLIDYADEEDLRKAVDLAIQDLEIQRNLDMALQKEIMKKLAEQKPKEK